MHHGQEIDLESIGVACSFLIEDWIEVFPEDERACRIGFSVGAHVPCWQLPNVRLDVDLLALRRKPRGLDRLLQQRRVLAWKAAPGAERVEAVGEAVLVNEGRQRADLLEPLGGRHQNVPIRAQPAPIVETILGDEAHVGRNQIP